MLKSATTPGSATTPSSRTSRRARLAARLSGSRHSQRGDPFDDEYLNPLEGMSRWRLSANAMALRAGASFSFSMGNRYNPAPPTPTRTIYLDSTLSDWRESQAIRVDIWEPEPDPEAAGQSEVTAEEIRNKHDNGGADSGEDETANDEKAPEATYNTDAVDDAGDLTSSRKRMGLINFHGGGFVLGAGTDDSRWSSAVMESFHAVVFSVNYRLAPGYPYPTPVEDAVDAIVQICARAEEFNLDTSQILLSGFSAGGTLALSAWAVLQDPTRWAYDLPTPVPSIAGLALFYPLLDWTIPREVKRGTCSQPDQTLSPSLTDLFDASYIYPPIPHANRDDPRLSPGLMDAELLSKMPPVHLCLCELDMLLNEGLKFSEKLKEAGRTVTTRVVLGEKHAWDKPPPFAPPVSVGVEYQAAIVAMRHWVHHDTKKITKQEVSMVSDETKVSANLLVKEVEGYNGSQPLEVKA